MANSRHQCVGVGHVNCSVMFFCVRTAIKVECTATAILMLWRPSFFVEKCFPTLFGIVFSCMFISEQLNMNYSLISHLGPQVTSQTPIHPHQQVMIFISKAPTYFNIIKWNLHTFRLVEKDYISLTNFSFWIDAAERKEVQHSLRKV